MWLSEISPPSTLYTTHPRSSIRFPVGRITPSLCAGSNRRSKPWRSGPLCVPVMRTSTQTQSPCPKPRTQVHERSGRGLAPGLESLLNRFATLHRLPQVRARHDDIVHVETPQMVPVPLVDCFKRGINHAKVLFDGHLGFPPPNKRWKPDDIDGLPMRQSRRTAETST